MSLTLRLPRDAPSVPAARRIVRTAMEQAGVAKGCVDDVVLALSEACTNALLHAGPGDAYDVTLELEPERGVVLVRDVGRGFDPGRRLGPARPDAERGRGLALMRALVDRVQLTSRQHDGTVVRLEKRLTYDDPLLVDR
jgi:serine/threonine-protein kinase RsbW